MLSKLVSYFVYDFRSSGDQFTNVFGLQPLFSNSLQKLIIQKKNSLQGLNNAICCATILEKILRA